MFKNGKNRKCIKKKCAFCGCEFNSRTDRDNLFCSRLCFNSSKIGVITSPRYNIVCKNCGKDYISTNPKSVYCSTNCRQKFEVKKNNPNWKGGKYIHKGYVWTLTSTGKYIPEQRYIMESILGRNLEKNEVVHHINGDKLDNRLKNLQVMSKESHISLHHKGKTIPNEIKLRISKKLTGNKLSESSKLKKSVSMKEYWAKRREFQNNYVID